MIPVDFNRLLIVTTESPSEIAKTGLKESSCLKNSLQTPKDVKEEKHSPTENLMIKDLLVLVPFENNARIGPPKPKEFDNA